MPLLHIHGSDDPFIPFLGGIGKQEVSQLPRLSVARSIEAFVKADGASARPTVNDIPDTANDGTTIRQYTYASKSDPQAVVLYEVKGGGHAWPGGVVPIVNGGKSSQNLDASRTVINFFNAHGGGRKNEQADENLPPGLPRELTAAEIQRFTELARNEYNQNLATGLAAQMDAAKLLVIRDNSLMPSAAMRQRFLAQNNTTAAAEACTS